MSKADRKREMREAREQAERDGASALAGKRRKQFIGIGLFAAILVAVLIAVSAGGGSDSDDPATDATATEQLLAGIDQDGTVLGDPEAPLTMLEFADPQCPFCAEFSEVSIPPIVEQLVRSGELRIQFVPLTFLGPDSELAARFAVAAGEQGKLWQFIELFYANQGIENSGYVTEQYLLDLASQIDGLDGEQALAAADSPEVTKVLDDARTIAADVGVDSTPALATAPTAPGAEADAEILDVDPLDTQAVIAALEDAIAQADDG